MWCTTCQQEVPGQRSHSPGRTVCPRCQTELTTAAGVGAHTVGIRGSGPPLEELSTPDDPLPSSRDWRLERQLKDMERVVRKAALPSRRQWQRHGTHEYRQGEIARTSAPASTEAALPAVAPVAIAARNRSIKTRTPWLALLMIAWGLAGLCSGIGLLWWSITRPALAWWSWGLTATLAGQGLLIVGLAFFALRLWQQCRRAVMQLDNLESHLLDLHRTAREAAGTA